MLALLSAWPGIFVGIAGTVLTEPLIVLLYGEQYQEAAAILAVLIWLIPVTLLHGHYRYTLIAYGRQQLDFLCGAYGAGLAVILSAALVPVLGPIGAAWALVASEILIGGLAFHFVQRDIAKIPFWPHLYRPAMAGAVLLVALLLLPTANLFLRGSVAALLYCLLVLALQPEILRDARSVFVRNR